MTRSEIFDIWAPPGGRWSAWVKPVLFACIAEESSSSRHLLGMEPGTLHTHSDTPTVLDPVAWDQADRAISVPAPGDTALVLDLPGENGIWVGIGLVGAGYRPIPLYNAVPGPTLPALIGSPAAGPISVVNVAPIVAALGQATSNLAAGGAMADAPPAFLLDANRRGQGLAPAPGRFDNRSISFTTDFPSALFLAAQGIHRAIVIQTTGEEPQPDLAHTLCRWQEGGITIELKRLDMPGPAVPIIVRKPSAFGLLWQRALAMVGLRRHGLGGFGGFVPQPSAG